MLPNIPPGLQVNLRPIQNINQPHPQKIFLPTALNPPSQLTPATIIIRTPMMAPNVFMVPPIITPKIQNSVSSPISTPLNLDDYQMPKEVLTEFQKEISKELNGFNRSQKVKPFAENIIDIPQHLIVKLEFMTRQEQMKLEEEMKLEAIKKEEELKEKLELENAKNNSKLNKIYREEYLKPYVRPPRSNKSIQCSLSENDKLEKAKKEKERKEQEKLKMIKEDKCISTEDYDEEFESYFVYEPPKENDFRYLKDGYCECLICGKVCSSSAYIRRHLEQHKERSRLCCKCGKILKDPNDWHVHEMNCGRHKFMEGNGKCVVNTEPKKRVRAGNSLPSERICDYCGRQSKSLITHLDHLNTHTGEKPHKCTCGSRFRNINNYYSHRKKFGCKINPNYRPYGIKFRSRDDQIKEKKDKIKEKKDKIKEKKDKIKEKKDTDHTDDSKNSNRGNPDRYVCQVCHFRCRDYSQFRTHRRKHISERKFICKACNSCYKDAHSLQSHVRTKHLRKVECNICRRKISCSRLRIHMRLHTGKK